MMRKRKRKRRKKKRFSLAVFSALVLSAFARFESTIFVTLTGGRVAEPSPPG